MPGRSSHNIAVAARLHSARGRVSGGEESAGGTWPGTDPGGVMLDIQAPENLLPAVRSGSQHEMGKVFIGGLSRETTTDGLRGYFERFGDISDCVVMKDRCTGAPRGFGFVTYSSQVVADRVVAHRHVIDGKEVEAKPAVPRDSEALAGRAAPPPMGLPGLPGLPGQGLPGQGLHPQGLPSNTFAIHQGAPGMGGQARLGMASGMGGGGDSLGAGQTKKIFVGGLAHETNESDFISYFGARPPLAPSPPRPGLVLRLAPIGIAVRTAPLALSG